ncbi:MAG: CreA family protein [Alphaproteobacteria bacterium]
MSNLRILLLAGLCVVASFGSAKAEEDIGCVSTTFRMLGLANDKICITAFRDPDVEGIACYVSAAVTGGAKGLVGLAEDTSDASISCRQIGPIKIKPDLDDKQKVFSERRSILFKSLQVIRFFDKPNNSLVYLSYSDRIIEGSPKNSVSAVPIMPWPSK